jgi:predicted ribosomally synthesized peptide with SipW-like signal peptide
MDENKQKNKKRRRKILLSLLLIAFTGVILTASTYAWFTANKTVTVNQIDVNVAASNGLQVSVDGITWKTVITNADITGASATYAAAVN